jgi:signal transduction histidine kinase
MITLPVLMRSLKTRVTVSVLAIFVISLWSLSFYASRMLREDMQRVLGEQQFSAVSFMAAEVNAELDDRLRGLENVAGRIGERMPDDTLALQKFIDDRPVLHRMFSGGLIVVDANGTAIAEVPLANGRIGVNYADSGHVAVTLREGKSTIGKPAIDKRPGAPIFTMAVPIRDTGGKVLGALLGATDLGKPNFLDKISVSRYGQTGGYFLVAPQYRLVIMASDKSRIMQSLPAPGANPAIDRFIEGYEGSVVLVNAVGAEVLSSSKMVPLAGWAVSASLPVEEAFAPIHDMQQRMLLTTFFLTLIAGALTWWLLRRQLAPMLAAAEALARLSDANQPLHPLPVVHDDEIGQLIGGFNRLLTTLAQREAALKANEAELRRSNTELEQFSYSISHDMRQPLRMISSYLQLLEDGLADQLDGEHREYFDFAIDGAKRMDGMLRALLDYSRIGRKGKPPEWVDSRALLDEARVFLRPAVAEAQAEVRIEGDWPRVFVRPDDILRLLQNVIDNALKFRVEGRRPEVVVKSEVSASTPAGRWTVSVTDNGIGIIPGQIGRLFQVFQRLQSRTVYEGTGIGLALCRRIVECHGGSIRAESAGEGMGCSFIFTLPVSEGDVPNVANILPANSADTASGAGS